MKRIIYTRPDGGVSIVTPAPNARMEGESESAFLSRIMAKDVPQDAANVAQIDESKIPVDREFRNAWERGTATTPVKVNPTKAKAVQEERIRLAKRVKARELMEREFAGENVAAEKAALQAIDEKAVLSGANTVAKLKAAWPAGLNKPEE